MKTESSSRKIIALCGKGGAGKTAIAAMLAGSLIRARDSSRILLIDADPAGGLAMAMGVTPRKTVAEVRERIIGQARKKDPAIKREIAQSIDYYILDALEERPSFSLLSMGRSESAGCFCPVNTLLREAIEALAGNFDHIIIDGEAGIEQIMRQVMKSVDTLLVISDLSARGLNTARLIGNLVKGKSVMSAPEAFLVINRATRAVPASEVFESTGIELAATIPDDPLIGEMDALSKTLVDLPPDNPAMVAVDKLARSLLTFNLKVIN